MSRVALRGIKYLEDTSPHHLPSEYLELEYILSSLSGNCYIDTGIKAQGGVTWEIEHEVTNTYGWAGVIGCRQQSGAYRYWLIYSGTTYEVGLNGDYNSTVLCQIRVKRKHKQTISEGTTWNWSSYFWNYSTNQWVLDMSNSAPAPTTLGNLFLSAVDYTNEGYASMYAYGLKTYECKIYTSTGGVETLARHFIPAIQKSDDAVGMYDLVTSTFFPSNGTNPYIAGPICQKESLSVIGVKPKTRVPTEYTELDRIMMTSNAGCRIATGVIPNKNYKALIKCGAASYGCFIFGTNDAPSYNGTKGYTMFVASSGGNSCWGGTYSSVNISLMGGMSRNTPYELSITYSGITNITNHATVDFPTETSSFTATTEIYLFLALSPCNYNNVTSCYYWKCWDDLDNLIRDMVPVLRKSDSEVGMYDLVNGVFYPNDGTSTFGAGDPVTTNAHPMRLVQTFEEE